MLALSQSVRVIHSCSRMGAWQVGVVCSHGTATDDSDDDVDTPVDPDIALITDYLRGELSPERAAEVSHRLETMRSSSQRLVFVKARRGYVWQLAAGRHRS